MKQLIRRYPITYFLLGLTSLVFLALQIIYFGRSTSGQAIFEFGGMYGDYVKAFPSQLWRLVTPIFVHIGWGHFFLNMLTLYFIGQIAEQIWGHHRFLALYILSGVMGNAATLWLTPNVIAAGASTALFGVFAGIALLGYRGENPAIRQIGKTYQALIVLNLVSNLVTPSVSIVGHLGGLLGGVLISLAISTVAPVSQPPLISRSLAGCLYAILLAGIISLAFLSV